MARTDNLTNFLTDIADSIREKKGTTEVIKASEFDTEIASIESSGGGEEPTKGIVFTDYDTNGIPTTIKLIGNVTIHQNMFNGVQNFQFINNRYQYGNVLNSILKIDFSKYSGTPVATYAENAFAYLGHVYPNNAKGVTLINFPNNLLNSYYTYCFKFSNIENDILDIFKRDKAVPIYCFQNAKLPNLISIGDDVLTLNQYAFNNAIIPKLTLPESITTIGNYCFERSTIGINKLPNDLKTIGSNAFLRCENITINKIPDSITALNASTFEYCTSITTMNLNNCTTIGTYCFRGCTNLETVTFVPNTKVINNYSFTDTGLINVNITSDELTNLGQFAFQNCKSLKQFILNGSSKITSGMMLAFNGDAELEVFSAKNTTMLWARNIFSGCSNLKKVLIYKFSSVMDANNISNNSMFSGCSKLKQIWIGFVDTITTNQITRYSLSGATSLEKCYIDLPRAKVESLQYYSTRFSNNTVPETCQFICNDDADWITNEEFAELVVE